MIYICYHCDRPVYQCECGAMQALLDEKNSVDELVELYDVDCDDIKQVSKVSNPNFTPRSEKHKSSYIMSFAA